MQNPTPFIRYDFDCVGSTNDEAKRLATDHPGRVVLVTAKRQSGGRGRHGRSWVSPEGGAWFSLAVPMSAHDPAVSLAVGRAVIESLSVYTDGLTLKHPNDILHRGKKLAGILCEQAVTTRDPQTVAILGVGINVNLDTADLGEGLRTPPVSLRDILGQEVALPRLIDVCAEAVVNHLQAT